MKIFFTKAQSHKRFAKHTQRKEKDVFKETNAWTTMKSGMKVYPKTKTDVTHVERKETKENHTGQTIVKDQVEEMSLTAWKQK